MRTWDAKKLTDESDWSNDNGRPRLWIHTGAGPRAGFGHLRRCMVLAAELGDQVQTCFVLRMRDRWSGGSLKARGFTYVREDLANIWTRMPRPAAILIDTRLREDLDDFILTARQRNIPVMSLHDLGLNPLATDIAIDGSIAPMFSQDFEVARTFGGPTYMVLDPVFQELHRRPLSIRGEIRSVVVSLGGGDAREHFWRVLKGLRLWATRSERAIKVVGMRGFVDWGQEQFNEEALRPLCFRWESKPVGAFLRDADLAITAGGISAYEALCAGTPLLAMVGDSLQQTTVRRIAAAGGCVNLGVGRELAQEQLAELIGKIDADASVREKFARRGRKIVDGLGAVRVASIIRRTIEYGLDGLGGGNRIVQPDASGNLLGLAG